MGSSSLCSNGAVDDSLLVRLLRSLRAITRDMAGFAASVTCLPSSAQRAPIRSLAIPTDMAQLPTGITLHGLRLTITSIMVRATAFIACRRAWVYGKYTPAHKSAGISTTGGVSTSSPSNSTHLLRASPCQMSRIPAGVATASNSAASRESQCRAVCLNVSKALAMVALFGFGSSRVRASIGFVSRLLAIVTKALRR